MWELTERLRKLGAVYSVSQGARPNLMHVSVFLKSDRTREQIAAAAKAVELDAVPGELPAPGIHSVEFPNLKINWAENNPNVLTMHASTEDLDKEERNRIVQFFRRLNPLKLTNRK